MSEAEVDALIERAGLSDVMSVYYSAIEIDPHGFDAKGERGYDGYKALAALVAAERDLLLDLFSKRMGISVETLLEYLPELAE
jgi:hypothetical protein